MPDPGLAPFTTVFRAGGDAQHRVRRNRLAVSCTACQRRKSKCDRRQPCGACEKRGDAEACHFGSSATTTAAVTGGGGGGGVGRAAGGRAGQRGRSEVQLRLNRLEEMVKGLADAKATRRQQSGREPLGEGKGAASSNGAPVPRHHRIVLTDEADDEDGHGDYHGATSWAALVDSIHDIQTLLSQSDDQDEPAAADAGPRLPAIGPEGHDVLFPGVQPVSVADIVGTLPPRADADRLLGLFFNAKFISKPFLHAHQFRRRYEAFWADPASAPLLWVSIMFSVLSAGVTVAKARDRGLVARLREERRQRGQASQQVDHHQQQQQRAQARSDNSDDDDNVDNVDNPEVAFRVKAAQCLVAGKYLRARALSVEALVMYAHCCNIQQHDSDSTLWSLYEVGVRLAQKRGYHRDAARIGLRLTPFEAEMRRRTWFMVQSSDLLFSFQHGVPSSVDDALCDVAHPTNLADEDFDERSDPLPPPRQPVDPLPILAYVVKSQLCRVLRRVVRLTLDPEPGPPPYARVRELHDQLTAWHDGIPPCLRVRPVRDTAFTDQNYTIMHRLMLELMYLKTLCVLHRPFLTVGHDDDDDDDDDDQGKGDDGPAFSRRVCREAAVRLLELHLDVDAAMRPGGRMHEDRYMVSSLTYHHFLLAAMVLCLDLSESTDYSLDERASRTRLLHAIHAVWSSRAATSRDAAHATRILRAILSRVETPPSDASPLAASATASAPTSSVSVSPPGGLAADASYSSSFSISASPSATATATASPDTAASSSGAVASAMMHDGTLPAVPGGVKAAAALMAPPPAPALAPVLVSLPLTPGPQAPPQYDYGVMDVDDDYPVNFDEMPQLDSFFSSPDGVDWHSIDQFLRLDRSMTDAYNDQTLLTDVGP